MDTTIPRWEWRTFGRDFGHAETVIRQQPLDRRDSSEIYILCARSDINAKIRNGTLDIKRLQNVDRHGLEQWRPILKAPFPLTGAPLADVFAAWGLPIQSTLDETCSESRFLNSLVAGQPSLTAIPVTKLRHGGTFDDCIVEIADLTFDGEPIRTMAVEMTDPDRVWRTVSALGLAGYDNVNYVTALRRFLNARAPAPGRARL